ncbi:MAG: CheR family methyltransferase [Acidobacteriota bacterium]
MPETSKSNNRSKRKNNRDLFVVGLGASAGGIPPLEKFFESLPPVPGMAFVVILHLSPEHESNLAAVLQRKTQMPVIEIKAKTKIKPNEVYVISPNQYLVMNDGYIDLKTPETEKGKRAAIDLFFRTLAEAYDTHAIGIVLSGTGTDGTVGLRRIREKGGISIVQEPQEAQYNSMPRSAIEAAAVDFILPVEQMANTLGTLREASREIKIFPEGDKLPRAAEADALREILAFLRVRTGHDFNHYKESTVLRRITRRMQVNTQVTLATYLRFVREHPAEIQELLSDLLITVTNFFRDGDAFEALEQEVIPKLFQNKSPDDPIRVWVVGCATGEEAYSVAILLMEYAEQHNLDRNLQVFATDIDEESISSARDATYPDSIEADVSAERLKRFFYKEGQHYRIRKEIREMVLFAPHNVLRDPPFSRLDLITCRNLLIYLNRETQDRVLEVFHFALNPNAYLFLGSSESADNLPELFIPVNKKFRIFMRNVVSHTPSLVPLMPLQGRWEIKMPESILPRRGQTFSYGDLHQYIIEQTSPPSVLVNPVYDIVHLSENAGRFLRFTGGEPSRNLLKVVHPDLRLDLRAALFAASQGQTAETRRVPIALDGVNQFVNIVIRPITKPDAIRGFNLVIFDVDHEGVALKEEKPKEVPTNEMNTVVRQLEDDLQRTKEQLRTTIEQYETSNEELKASNEELQAINEELRSATEELETSKEEMQSVNEELTTVNHELKDKVDEVSRANSDLQNLLASTDIGTIFLDRRLCISRYTPRVMDLFNIIPSDVGRPFFHLTHKLEKNILPEKAEQVLETLMRVEEEIRSQGGRYYIARISPYRTLDDKIDGVALTFVDITERKKTEEALRESEQLFRAIVSRASAGITRSNLNGELTFVNQQFCEMLGYSETELLGKTMWQLTCPNHVEETIRLFKQLVADGTSFQIEKCLLSKDGAEIWCNVMVSAIRDSQGKPQSAVAVIHDINTRRNAEEALRLSEERLHLILDSITDYAILTLDNQRLIKSWSTGAVAIFGYTDAQAIGQSVDMIFTPEDRENNIPQKEIDEALTRGRAEDERWHLRKNGSRFYASGVMTPLRDSASGDLVKILRDLTIQKKAEEVLQRSHDDLEERIKTRTGELEDSNLALKNEVQQRISAEHQVKGLLRRNINSQELERQRLSRDLHDTLGQQLTALRLTIESLKEHLQLNPEIKGQINQIETMLRRLDAEVDFLAWELRPGPLVELGFVTALEGFVQDWSKHFQIQVEFHATGLTGVELSTEIETHLYRIAQEALNNIAKHANASYVNVLLERRDQFVVLVIEDNGIGFDVNEKSTLQEGLGLLSMRERTVLIGGELDIESTLNEGTTVFVRVPVALS